MHRGMGLGGLVVALAMGLLLGACGGGGAQVEMPTDQARLLNNEIGSAWARVQALLDESARTASALAEVPAGLNAGSFDVGLTRQVLDACLGETVQHVPGHDRDAIPRTARGEAGPEYRPLTGREATGQAIPCNPPRMVALEAYVETVDPTIREAIVERVLVVDSLRVNLRDTLVRQLDALERRQQAGLRESEALRSQAEEALQSARNRHPSGTDERRRAELDYQGVLDLLDELDQILERIGEEIGDQRRLRRQLVDEASRSIATMGTR